MRLGRVVAEDTVHHHLGVARAARVEKRRAEEVGDRLVAGRGRRRRLQQIDGGLRLAQPQAAVRQQEQGVAVARLGDERALGLGRRLPGLSGLDERHRQVPPDRGVVLLLQRLAVLVDRVLVAPQARPGRAQVRADAPGRGHGRQDLHVEVGRALEIARLVQLDGPGQHGVEVGLLAATGATGATKPRRRGPGRRAAGRLGDEGARIRRGPSRCGQTPARRRPRPRETRAHYTAGRMRPADEARPRTTPAARPGPVPRARLAERQGSARRRRLRILGPVPEVLGMTARSRGQAPLSRQVALPLRRTCSKPCSHRPYAPRGKS